MSQTVSVSPIPGDADQSVPSGKFSPAKAWSPQLAEKGYVAIVRPFLDYYSTLKPYSLTSGEALFVIHLMRFKWGEGAPFPSYKKLARLMGVSAKMARRYAQALEQKKLLVRNARKGRPNRFDLRPLFEALEKRIELEAAARRPTRAAKPVHATDSEARAAA
jgi:DNA-binding transcriptional regulator YhcF (GntR family)